MRTLTTRETVVGFGVYDEDWTLRALARFDGGPAVTDEPFTWSITSVKADVEEIDPWVESVPSRHGPWTVTSVALLREDLTPIDAKEVDPIDVPEGYFLGDVRCDIKLTLPPYS